MAFLCWRTVLACLGCGAGARAGAGECVQVRERAGDVWTVVMWAELGRLVHEAARTVRGAPQRSWAGRGFPRVAIAPGAAGRGGFPLVDGAALGRPLAFEALTPKCSSETRQTASSGTLRSCSPSTAQRHKSSSWDFRSTALHRAALSFTIHPVVGLEIHLSGGPSISRSSPGSAPPFRGARHEERLESEASCKSADSALVLTQRSSTAQIV